MTDDYLRILTLEEINSFGAGDWKDVDVIVHSLQHHGYMAWYENVKSMGHATHSQIWIDDEELAYIVNSDMTGSMIEEWNGVDEDQVVPIEDRVEMDCGYCGEKIQTLPSYNGHSQPKPEDNTMKPVLMRVGYVNDEFWHVTSRELTEEENTELVNFLESMAGDNLNISEVEDKIEEWLKAVDGLLMDVRYQNV